MEQSYKFQAILDSPIVKATLKSFFDDRETETIIRPTSFIIRLKNEPEDKIVRIIFLPPNGFTAHKIDETNPHPEVRKAKIEIKGGVKPNKTGFNPLKDVIKFQYYTKRNIKITEDEPYPNINQQEYKEEIKSSKEKFFVVQENGIGFYHSLVNLTNEWVFLILEKELRLQKTTNLQQAILNLDKNQQKIINLLYDKILLHGDEIFEKEGELLQKICNFDVDIITPPLIEMLNVLETGKHEPCTVYAILLKVGRKNNIIEYLKEAVKNKTAPKYYLEELIQKLSN